MSVWGACGRLAAAIFFTAVLTGGPARAAAPPPLSAYGTLPATEDLALSPNGELFARVSTEGEKRLLVVEKVGGGLVAGAYVADVKVAGIAWGSDEHVIVYIHETQKPGVEFNTQEFVHAVVLNVKTRKLSPLLSNSGKFIPALFGHHGFVTEDGEPYVYAGLIPLDPARDGGAGWLTQGYPDLYKIGLNSGDVRRVAAGGKDRDWVLDEKGEVVALSDYDNRRGTWKVMQPGSLKPIASGEAAYGFSLAGLGRRPGTVIVREATAEGTALLELSLADGSLTEFVQEGPVEDLIWSRTTRLLTGMIMAGERSRIVMLDPVLAGRMKSIEKAFGNASLTLDSLSVSADSSKIVVYVESSGTTGTWQMVDFNTKKASPLADAHPGIPQDVVGSVEVVSYRAGDGLTIPGLLTLPPGGARSGLPLVVMPHGGPESMDKVGFDWMAQAFASRGYAVLQPNFRGSSGHGAEFRNAGFGQMGRKMQTDISDGVADLAARGIVNPARVCIVGGSYGGYAALAGVTLQHGLYRCAASYAGISDPTAQLRYDSNQLGPTYKGPALRYWRSYYGIPESTIVVPDDISPVAHAAEADAPVLLIHGKDDTVVPIDQSDRMETALRKAGKPVERVTLKGEDHWRSRSATRLQMLEAMMAFVQKHNPAGPPALAESMPR